MHTERRHFTGAQKMAILRQHLIEQTPISEVCQQHGLQPTAFYLWQKQLFEQGAALLERPKGKSSGRADAKRIEVLQASLRQKNDALADLASEYMAIKKGMERL